VGCRIWIVGAAGVTSPRKRGEVSSRQGGGKYDSPQQVAWTLIPASPNIGEGIVIAVLVMILRHLVAALDRLVAFVISYGRFLALPVVLLLFLQWPLRDFVRAYSREANDLGQWLFALYVAMAVTAATRAHTHLATDVIARGYSVSAQNILSRVGALIGVLPWALFVLAAGYSIVMTSVLGLEAFPDTTNPGYFLIKIALWLLAALMLLQGFIDLLKPRGA
jgi:TRAP-type mannitol/chloroaromatic compound transport system permease small subunit